jgi:hypothetical protein
MIFIREHGRDFSNDDGDGRHDMKYKYKYKVQISEGSFHLFKSCLSISSKVSRNRNYELRSTTSTSYMSYLLFIMNYESLQYILPRVSSSASDFHLLFLRDSCSSRLWGLNSSDCGRK